MGDNKTVNRLVRTFLISWGQKTRIEHYNVDLSWNEFWFAIICIDMNVFWLFLLQSNNLEMVSIVSKWVNMDLIENRLFTRGQFWPSGIVIGCVCGSVCPCVCINHELVRTITHRSFKLGSPYLDQRCKIPWFRSLLFWGMIDLDLQGQI